MILWSFLVSYLTTKVSKSCWTYFYFCLRFDLKFFDSRMIWASWTMMSVKLVRTSRCKIYSLVADVLPINAGFEAIVLNKTLDLMFFLKSRSTRSSPALDRILRLEASSSSIFVCSLFREPWRSSQLVAVVKGGLRASRFLVLDDGALAFWITGSFAASDLML